MCGTPLNTFLSYFTNNKITQIVPIVWRVKAKVSQWFQRNFLTKSNQFKRNKYCFLAKKWQKNRNKITTKKDRVASSHERLLASKIVETLATQVLWWLVAKEIQNHVWEPYSRYKWSWTSAHKSFLVISGRLCWKLSNNVFCLQDVSILWSPQYCRKSHRVGCVNKKKLPPPRCQNLSNSRMTYNKETSRARRGLNYNRKARQLLTKQI